MLLTMQLTMQLTMLPIMQLIYATNHATLTMLVTMLLTMFLYSSETTAHRLDTTMLRPCSPGDSLLLVYSSSFSL
jgi:hypothetical protein